MQSLPPALADILSVQLAVSPRHKGYLDNRFASVNAEEAELLESLATGIKAIAGDDLETFCRDYDFVTQIMVEEEIFFRRNDRYRLSTLQEAIEQVYSREAYMASYMNGLLLTQLWWGNHTQAMLAFRDHFLKGATGACLEIGPGHGLLLRLACEAGFDKVAALDISPSSVERTKHALRSLGANADAVEFHVGDFLDPKFATSLEATFDSIVFSEVLEHLDQPALAMSRLRSMLKPGGRLYIHVPANSPAPDHLFLLRSPQEAQEFVSQFDMNVVFSAAYPGANLTLEKALRFGTTISCVFVLERQA